MMIQAVLGNPNHPEYGVATIPFPIPHDQYAHCMELLEALEIGDAVKADCQVQEINSFYSALKRTEMLPVNVEELNYLAKRLDSFDVGEAAQFQAMAHKLELSELKDLINLTFCCQETTVITDFSDLAAVGRDHYMNLHGGCATVAELEVLDGEGTARQLIEGSSGTVTPYNNVSCLHMPVQNDLSGSLPIFLTELGKQRLFTQRPVAVPERIPRLCGHAVFAQKGFQLRLLIVRVQLGLQYGGLHFAQGQYLLKVI